MTPVQMTQPRPPLARAIRANASIMANANANMDAPKPMTSNRAMKMATKTKPNPSPDFMDLWNEKPKANPRMAMMSQMTRLAISMAAVALRSFMRTI